MRGLSRLPHGDLTVRGHRSWCQDNRHDEREDLTMARSHLLRGTPAGSDDGPPPRWSPWPQPQPHPHRDPHRGRGRAPAPAPAADGSGKPSAVETDAERAACGARPRRRSEPAHGPCSTNSGRRAFVRSGGSNDHPAESSRFWPNVGPCAGRTVGPGRAAGRRAAHRGARGGAVPELGGRRARAGHARPLRLDSGDVRRPQPAQRGPLRGPTTTSPPGSRGGPWSGCAPEVFGHVLAHPSHVHDRNRLGDTMSRLTRTPLHARHS